MKVQVWSRENEVTWYLVHRILEGRNQTNKGSGNKDQLGGMGGQKGKTEEQLGIRVSRQGALQAR